MTVTRGKEHNLFGMNFVFNDDATVSISMKEYLKVCITESKLQIARNTNTPATKDLFETDKSLPMLPKDNAEAFHSTVAKLLFVSLHGRPGILPAISLLCTRVTKSTLQDQRKLQRLL
jgi:hypothetical protein